MRVEIQMVRERFFWLIRHLTITQKLVMSGILVGCSSGFSAFLFEKSIVFFSSLFHSWLAPLSLPWKILGTLLLPAMGAGMGGALIYFFCPEAKGHGTDEVLKAITESEGHIRGRVAWVKLLASASTIGFGGSAGREGPVIQIGGAVGSWIGRTLRAPSHELKVMVAAGASAGLAASFGVPLAAVFFTMEVIMRDFASESFPAVVIASVSGAATARLFLGGEGVLVPVTYVLISPMRLFFYALLGLICAPFGVFYMKAILKTEHWIAERSKLPTWLWPAIGGVVVGGLALILPEIMGTGQTTIELAIRGGSDGWRSGALALGKIAATCATLGTGGSGGAFMPVLFIGSTLGSAVSAILRRLFGVALQRGAFALVGMACLVTSAYRAPVTAMVMAWEMSQDYAILMPVMFACVISHLVSRRGTS